MRTAPCIESGCDRIAHARRLCRKHYAAALKSGDLPPLVQVGLEQTDEERFFSRVEQDGNGCWVWTGAKSDTGYGSWHPRDGGAANAHRWSYEFLIAEIPQGLVIDHLCRNRACVNPWHLEPVTNRVNIARGLALEAMRQRAAEMTHCPHGHEKTEANVYRSFNPKRKRWESVCRPCRNARLRRRAAEKRAA